MHSTQTLPVIVESIDINAPLAAVYAALTTPEQLVQWWGSSDSYHVTAMDADVRPGGAWKTTGSSPNGQSFSVSGVYRVVDPPNMIEFTWIHDWIDDGEKTETIVRYDLRERDGVTSVTVTHGGFTDVGDRDDHARGWKTVLGWLQGYFHRYGGE